MHHQSHHAAAAAASEAERFASAPKTLRSAENYCSADIVLLAPSLDMLDVMWVEQLAAAVLEAFGVQRRNRELDSHSRAAAALESCWLPEETVQQAAD